MSGRRQRRGITVAGGRQLPQSLDPWLIFRLTRAASRLQQRSETALEPHGLRLGDFAVLAVVARLGPVSQRAVGGRVGIDRTTICDAIARLEDEGLVGVSVDPFDLRRRVSRVTSQGASLVTASGAALTEAENGFLRRLSDADRHALRSLLWRIEPPSRIELVERLLG